MSEKYTNNHLQIVVSVIYDWVRYKMIDFVRYIFGAVVSE